MNLSHRQWQALRSQLREAQQHIPVYREVWGRHGIDVRELREPADLARLPLLTRADLLAAGTTGRLAAGWARGTLRATRTSGSSGTPLTVLLDRRTRRRRQWRFLRALLACGYRPGQRLMLVSSRPSDTIQQVSPLAGLARWHYIDLYAGADHMADAFLAVRPQVLYGPQHALLLLAAELQRRGVAAPGPRLLVSTSEQLTRAAQRQLRTVFHPAGIADFYGLTECGLLAWRAPGAARYALASEAMHMEFISQGCAAGHAKLVVTDLQPGAMPLFRYLTGDVVRGDFAAAVPAVLEFAGKQLDALLLPDGRRILPYLVDEALSGIDGLRRYRVVQQADLAIDLTIDAGGERCAEAAREAIARLCERRIDIRLQPPPAREPALSHKSRPIISHAQVPA